MPTDRTPRSRSGPATRAAGLALVALVAAACGGDTDDVTADESSAQILTTVTEPEPDETAAATTDAATTDADGDGDDGTTTSVPTTDDPPTSTVASTTTEPADPPEPEPPAPTVGDPEIVLTPVASVPTPVDLASRAGDDAIYVVSQTGIITRIAASGDTTVVLDVADLTRSGGERGLLGLALAPEGDRAYLNYTAASDGATTIAEVPVTADGDFDRDGLRIVLTIPQPYSNHNGGDLAIGPDGLLYIGTGDGGSANDPERRSLDLGSLLGKMLRIDPTPSGDLGYSIPDDNPFVDTDGARPEIWSIGLRNPWKFTFDPATDDLWIADVGQNRVEEITVVPRPADGGVAGRGLSFGWSAYEGDERFNSDQPADGHVAPILTYRHTDGCSISGGAPYRGLAVPELEPAYVYSDLCAGTIWALDVAGGRNLVLAQASTVIAVVAGGDGELYVLEGAGRVLRIDPT